MLNKKDNNLHNEKEDECQYDVLIVSSAINYITYTNYK